MTTYIHYYTLVGITTTYHKHWVNIIANEEYMLKSFYNIYALCIFMFCNACGYDGFVWILMTN
jgi:hypothetical protein